MSKIFVIAGNHEQATRWMKENIQKRMTDGETSVSYSDYVLRVSRNNLLGISNPHGVFIGTWMERDDMDEIFMSLLSHTLITEKSHRIINRLYGQWMESKGRSAYNNAISVAAQSLSDAIDAQVLKELIS